MSIATLARSLPTFSRDGVVAVLDIPKIGLWEEVRTGCGQDAVDKGVTRHPYSPAWGDMGTIDLIGHRSTLTAPFFWLGELDRDDDIFVVTSATTPPWHYRVLHSQDLVSLEDPVLNVDRRERVLAEAMGEVTDRLLVLCTCSPAFSSNSRLLVTAALVNPNGSIHA